MKESKAQIMSGVRGEVISSRVVANNTVEYHQVGRSAFRLHSTDVVTVYDNGDVVLDSGGWRTVTTKGRIAAFMPDGWSLFQAGGLWYVSHGVEQWVFADGMTIHLDGTVTGAAVDYAKATAKLKKDIATYVDGYMTFLASRKMTQPTAGDCWMCSLKEVKSRRPLGEVTKDTTHLVEHFKEKYYVPSLVMNAVELFEVSQAAKHCLGFWFKYHEEKCGFFEDVGKRQIRQSLLRYLKRQFSLAA